MRTHKRMKAWLDSGEGATFDCLWIYDSKDPLIYQLWLPQILGDETVTELRIRWNIGRELVRTGLGPDNKIGGQKDILVIPPIDGTTTIYLANGDRAVLISMNTDELQLFDRDAHRLVSADEEMDLAMKKLLSEVM